MTKLYLFIIAHPDDESMFFTPTIHALLNTQKKEDDVKVGILCLCNGNYDGLGQQRELEMKMALLTLGFTGESQYIKVAHEKGLQDGPKEDWDENVISQQIHKYLQTIFPHDNHHHDDNNCARNKLSVTLLTFDALGVSQHINHIHTHRGVHHFLSQFTTSNTNNIDSMAGYELISMTNPLWKYNPFVLWMYMLFSYLFCSNALFHKSSSLIRQEDKGLFTTHDATYNTIMFDPLKVWYAMAAHESQFVWYRRLSVLFSRYTYQNQWRKMNV
mmetsp:Transcript_39210/g.58924  ORF Transcript_39210/g.58924 Transcript_39210/m.58924 type:complete len:272 (-) Transcript_39210:696-1511(-)